MIQALSSTLGTPVGAAVEVAAPVKRGPGRPRKTEESAEKKERKPRATTKDGRTASQVVRDFDEKYFEKHGELSPAADVIAACEKLGLTVAPALVYNVRQNVKKAEEAAAAAAEAEKKAKARAKAKAEKAKEKPAKAKAEAEKAPAKAE